MPLEPATRTCTGSAPAIWRSEGRVVATPVERAAKRGGYFTVLRDGMTIDPLSSPAVYFDTTTGQLWIGRDSGERWEYLFDSLPHIHNVKVAVV